MESYLLPGSGKLEGDDWLSGLIQRGSIALLTIGKRTVLHCTHIVAHSIGERLPQVGKVAQKFGFEAFGHPHGVGPNEDLPVGGVASANAYGSHADLAGNLFGKLGWNLLKHESEAAGLVEQPSLARRPKPPNLWTLCGVSPR